MMSSFSWMISWKAQSRNLTQLMEFSLLRPPGGELFWSASFFSDCLQQGMQSRFAVTAASACLQPVDNCYQTIIPLPALPCSWREESSAGTLLDS
jgi:hypothetical protein